MNTAEPSGGMVPRWTIGDRMRKARISAGMSTDEMAADIGRTRRTISNYESGSTEAPLLVRRQYALRTGVPFRWIDTGDPHDDGGGADSPVIAPATDRYLVSATPRVRLALAA